MNAKNIDSYIVFFGSKEAGKEFKAKLSELIKTNFVKPYDESNIKNILNFCLDYYAKQFELICQNETSYEFYKLMFWLHEQSVEMRRDKKAMDILHDDIGQEYFFVYRRVLKLILEQACVNYLVSEPKISDFKERTENTFDKLMFLGDEIVTFSSLLAKQDMIGDVVAMDFNEQGIYLLKRKHFFELAFEKIVDPNAFEPNSFVIDNDAEADFIKAVKDSFNVNVHDVWGIINDVVQDRQLGKWDALAIGTSDIKVAMNELYKIPEENTEAFLLGLYFSKHEKIPINKVVRKPYQINRFLNRPILIWNIEGRDYCIIGKYSMDEAMNSLMLNAFPWSKASKEWQTNPTFKTFLVKKEREHEKMLIRKVEAEIKSTKLIYQPNIKKFKKKAGVIHIQNEQCGEIDFIVVNLTTKKIFVIECKHLLGRYDMPNFYIDYNSFTEGKDAFNKKLEKKVNWIKNNIDALQEHFQLTKQINLTIKNFTVEGIFVINTPTFYMYYSDFRIYTFHDVAKVLTGQHIDKQYKLVIDEEEGVRTVLIRYPYFKKKYFIQYSDPYEDYPVDKYGDPIIPDDEEPIV
jgi:hypothetical protein